MVSKQTQKNVRWAGLFALLGGAVALPVACGGSDTTEGTDAAVDATTDTKSDTTADTGAVDAAETCVDASLFTTPFKDAALDDANASVGTCVSCTKTSCGQEATACDGECECRNALIGFYECQGNGTSFQACAVQHLNIAGAGQQVATTLATCVVSKCAKPCSVGQFLPN